MEVSANWIVKSVPSWVDTPEALVELAESGVLGESSQAELGGRVAAVFGDREIAAAKAGAEIDTGTVGVDLGQKGGVRHVEDIEHVFHGFGRGEVDVVGVVAVGDL